MCRVDTVDAVFALTFSKHQANHLLAGLGTGALTLYRHDAPTTTLTPVASWPEAHAREVFGVDGSVHQPTTVASCAWDAQLKLVCTRASTPHHTPHDTRRVP